jgi:hypothetical protein
MSLELAENAYENILTNIITNLNDIPAIKLLIKKLKENNFIVGTVDTYVYGSLVFVVTNYGKIYNGMLIKHIDGYITLRYYDDAHKTQFKRVYLDKVHTIYVKKANTKNGIDAVKLLASLDSLDD